MLVFLIGLSGSGKSYWARQLTNAWKWDHIDMDKMIVERTQKTVTQIFDEKGESFFRKLEQKLLLEIVNTKSNGYTIIATGGGTPCFHHNIDIMNTHGVTIYLEADATFLTDRLATSIDRPLLAVDSIEDLEKKINTMLTSRKKIYEQAAIKIDARTAVTTTFVQALTAYTGEALKFN